MVHLMNTVDISEAVQDALQDISSEELRDRILEYLTEITLAPGYLAGLASCFALDREIDIPFTDLPKKAQTFVVSVQIGYAGASKLRELFSENSWKGGDGPSQEAKVDLIMSYTMIAKAATIAGAYNQATTFIEFRMEAAKWVQSKTEVAQDVYADLESRIIDVIVELLATLDGARPTSEIRGFIQAISNGLGLHIQFPDAAQIKKFLENERQHISRNLGVMLDDPRQDL